MDSTDHAALLGRTIGGKFVVEALIGVGGMGAVYRARQTTLDRPVALKVLHRDLSRDQQFVDRFQREAQAASRLDHPHSVRVIEFGQDDGLLYIAMEYAEGRTLFDIVDQEWPLDERRTVHLMSQVLAALEVAHRLGVVHRDVKPENVIVMEVPADDGAITETVKVCDFGIAKVTVQADAALTTQGLRMGTPTYMSPEQARGELLDGRADIYSAGVVLYRLLAGRVPFAAETPLGIALRHITDTPDPPSKFARVSSGLEAVCLQAMAKSKQDRFETAGAMRAALRVALAEDTPPGSGVPEVMGPAATKRGGRTIWLTALATVAAAALVVQLTKRDDRAAPLPMAAPPAAVAAVPSPPAPPEPPLEDSEPGAKIAPEEVTPPAGTVPGDPAASGQETAPARTTAPETGPRPARKPRRKVEPVEPRRPPPEVKEVNEVKEVKETPPQVAALAQPPPPPQRPPPPLPQASPVAPSLPDLPPPPRALDLSRSNVALGEVVTSGAISATSVRSALKHVPLQACYRDALRAHGAPAGGKAALQLRIDLNGAVKSASLSGGAFLPSMKECLERAARSARFRDIDTGEASVVVTLEFSAGT